MSVKTANNMNQKQENVLQNCLQVTCISIEATCMELAAWPDP